MQPRERPEASTGAREEELLDATIELLLDVGYDRLTMDAVAKLARASKATLYRRWSSKQSLVVDAVTRSKRAVVLDPPDTGSLRGDLVELFCGQRGLGSHDTTLVLGVVVTALQTDAEFAREFRDQVPGPKIAVMGEIYRRAEARGELAPGADLVPARPRAAGNPPAPRRSCSATPSPATWSSASSTRSSSRPPPAATPHLAQEHA